MDAPYKVRIGQHWARIGDNIGVPVFQQPFAALGGADAAYCHDRDRHRFLDHAGAIGDGVAVKPVRGWRGPPITGR